MRISHKYKFVFIAIPRTGSTSIRAELDSVSDVFSVNKYQITKDNPFYNHISAAELVDVFKENGWNWDEYLKFCVVRNPFDRAVSLYHHKLDTQLRTAPDKSIAYKFIRQIKYKYFYSKSFEQWLNSPEAQIGLSRSVKEFTHNEFGECLVDHFLKFENLHSEFAEIAEKLNLDLGREDVRKSNESKTRSGYQDYYTEELKSLVSKRYSFEIDNFHYNFD